MAGDYTGREIQRTLVRRAAELGVAMGDDVYVTRLLVHEGRVFGAHGFDVEDGSRRGDHRRRGHPRRRRPHAHLAPLLLAA